MGWPVRASRVPAFFCSHACSGAVEAAVWASVYQTLGALPDGKSALLYSLSAMTTYGHERFGLAEHWQLMGALEALNGMILFGLTTAFLYSRIRELWAERAASS
jgi:hypothetical protein